MLSKGFLLLELSAQGNCFSNVNSIFIKIDIFLNFKHDANIHVQPNIRMAYLYWHIIHALPNRTKVYSTIFFVKREEEIFML